MSEVSSPTLAIVGATGAVGKECLSILNEIDWPADKLRLIASPRSAGTSIRYADRDITIQPLHESAFSDVAYAIFAAGGQVSRDWAKRAVAAGTTVVDNSSAFRMDPDVPLIIPEVNGETLELLHRPGIIANPNCSTIIALMAVTPIHRAAGVERMVVATYQAASGAGAAAMKELEDQAHDFAAGRPFRHEVFGRQYLFNLFSHNSAIGEDGYNEEESKLVRETRKIWDDPSINITATCVRVPVLRAHAEAINLQLKRDLSESAARSLLNLASGVEILDDRESNRFPEPILATGRDAVLVGRIRQDRSQAGQRGLDMFVVGDQLRKGAALNAVQIVQRLMSRG